ncbi:MAG TPA: MlaD family protein [Burkholderiales bacterium]
MENRAHAWAAGLFTLLLGAGIVLAAMWFTGDTYAQLRYVIESPYPVSGLNPQSTVRLRGVDVGKVESIVFAEGNARVIYVHIAVRAGTPITRNTVAQLRPQGITGLSYIMLDERGQPGEALPPGQAEARIPMRPAFTEELTESAKGLLTDARELMTRLDGLLSDANLAQVQRTLGNLEAVSERVTRIAATLEPAAKATPSMVEQARRTLAAAEPAIASIDELALQLSQRVDALDRVAKSAEQVGTAADSISKAVVSDAVPRVNLLVEEIMRTAGSLDRLLMQLRDQPSSVVFGPPRQPPGPGEQGYRSNTE